MASNSTSHPAVAGVLLAAGASTRMGTNKLMLRLEGQSVVRRAAQRALAADLDPLIVVLGFEAVRVREELTDLPCVFTANTDHALGMNRSVRMGLAAVPPTCEAAVVLLADMPLVTSEMIQTVVARYRSGPQLVASRYGDVEAPPRAYHRSLFREFDGPDGEGRGRQVAERHRDELVLVDFPAATLVDLDVADDYERLTTGRSK